MLFPVLIMLLYIHLWEPVQHEHTVYISVQSAFSQDVLTTLLAGDFIQISWGWGGNTSEPQPAYLWLKTTSFVLRSGSCEDRRWPPAPGSPVEGEVPTTRISAWPAPPPLRGTSSAQMRTSFPAHCRPPPFTPVFLANVTRLHASTARAARTARQKSGCRRIRTHSSFMAALCAPRHWITETSGGCWDPLWSEETLELGL